MCSFFNPIPGHFPLIDDTNINDAMVHLVIYYVIALKIIPVKFSLWVASHVMDAAQSVLELKLDS